MRKNLAKHTAKKLPLAKRVLALCFALIFVCSCLLPAFANGTGEGLDTPGTEVVEAADPGTEPEPMDLYDEPAAQDDDFAVADEPAAMDDDFAVADEPAAMDDDFAMDDEPAAMDDQVEKPVVDDEPAAMDNEVEKPVEGGEPPVADDTPAAEGATKTTTDASGNTVYEYDTSGTTFPEDDAAALPDGDQVLDKVDAAFSIPTNIYHFWLKKMSSYDLADIATDAEAAKMTVEQYLAMYGTDKGCYHIMTAADGANLKDYQFADPTSNDDPEGNSRTFAGWYYTDELGDEQKFVFDEHLYVSEGTTVEVYAKWDDAEEEEQSKYAGWYAELMQCSDSEFNELWKKYNDQADFGEFYAYIDSLSLEKQDALAARMNQNFEYQGAEIAAYADYQWADTRASNEMTVPASIFYLREPGIDPKSNLMKDWGSSRIAVGTVTVPRDSYSWQRGTDNEGNTQYYKNLYDNLGSRIVWPDKTTGLEWTIPKSKYSTAWTEIWNAYKSSVENELGKTLTEDDVESITLKAYKISRNNSEDPDKHIDCTVIVKCKTTYTANFWVEYVDVDGNNLVWSKNYEMDQSVDKTQADRNLKYTSTSYNRVEYVFDGWYNEAGRKVSEWPYTPDPDTELQDGEVNFYARYIPKDTALEDSPYITVEKHITGLNSVDDLRKDFYVVIGNYKKYLTEATKKVSDDGKKIILRWEVPVDAGTYWVSENYYQVDGYDVKTGGIDKNVTTEKANITVQKVEVYPSCKNQDFDVKTTDTEDIIFVAALHTQGQDTNVVISYHPLSAGVREVLKSKLNGSFIGSNDWDNSKTAFYSIEESGNQFSVANTVITYNEGTRKIHIDAKSKWTKAATLEWDISGGVNPEITITNDYTPNSSDLTVAKTVTGLLGDYEKQFKFTLSFDQPVDTSKITWTKSDETEVILAGQTYTFTLAHGQNIVFHGIPAGVTATVTEDKYDNYKTKYKIHDTGALFDWNSPEENNAASVTIDATAKTIQFLNHNEAEPDMGVLLDTLPYILILVVVAGGGVLLFLRKRKNDDDE